MKIKIIYDCGDVDGYLKLSRVYDALMKSGKFTEAQRKEEKAGEFDSVGQIVDFAESVAGGGKIERHKILTPIDQADEIYEKLSNYPRLLVKNDPNVWEMVKNWIRKRENLESQEEDAKKAEEQGLDQYILSDKDLLDYKNVLDKEKQEDDSFIKLKGGILDELS